MTDDDDRRCVMAESAGEMHDADRTALSGQHPAGCVGVESGDIDLLVADYAEARKKRCTLLLLG